MILPKKKQMSGPNRNWGSWGQARARYLFFCRGDSQREKVIIFLSGAGPATVALFLNM